MSPPVKASGDFVVIGGRISLSQEGAPDFELRQHHQTSRLGLSCGWKKGVATFTSTPEVMTIVRQYLQDGKDYVDSEERAKSFTPATAKCLFPHEQPVNEKESNYGGRRKTNDQDETIDIASSLFTERWHYQPEAPFKFIEGMPEVSVVECLILRSSYKTSESDEPALCVVILHLQSPKPSKNKDSLSSAAESAKALAIVAHEYIRKAEGRKATLQKLREHVGYGLDFSPLFGDTENSTLCYPVFTSLDLRADRDEDILAARELSTITPSAAHGSSNHAGDRVKRARKDFIMMSDEWGGSLTSRGAVFLSSESRRYEAAPLYVSAIYADVIAGTFLMRIALNQIESDAYNTLRQETEFKNYTQNLQQLLSLRRRLLLLNRGLGGLHQNESRSTKTIVSALRKNFHVEELELSVAQRMEDLVHTVKLQRDLAHADEAARDARETHLTNVFLASIGVLAIPPSLLFTVFETFRNYPDHHLWTWMGIFVWFLGSTCLIGFMIQRGRRDLK